MSMHCFHYLKPLDLSEFPYRYRCIKCDKRLKVASGKIEGKRIPKVNLALSTGEVLHLINLLELRDRTPEEEHILQTCYKSKIKNETFQ